MCKGTGWYSSWKFFMLSACCFCTNVQKQQSDNTNVHHNPWKKKKKDKTSSMKMEGRRKTFLEWNFTHWRSSLILAKKIKKLISHRHIEYISGKQRTEKKGGRGGPSQLTLKTEVIYSVIAISLIPTQELNIFMILHEIFYWQNMPSLKPVNLKICSSGHKAWNKLNMYTQKKKKNRILVLHSIKKIKFKLFIFEKKKNFWGKNWLLNSYELTTLVKTKIVTSHKS